MVLAIRHYDQFTGPIQVTVTLYPPNRLGRARIDLVDSEGKLKFGIPDHGLDVDR